VLVTLAGARMILGEVDRRRSGLELAGCYRIARESAARASGESRESKRGHSKLRAEYRVSLRGPAYQVDNASALPSPRFEMLSQLIVPVFRSRKDLSLRSTKFGLRFGPFWLGRRILLHEGAVKHG
jgi:hypothetical protein